MNSTVYHIQLVPDEKVQTDSYIGQLHYLIFEKIKGF